MNNRKRIQKIILRRSGFFNVLVLIFALLINAVFLDILLKDVIVVGIFRNYTFFDGIFSISILVRYIFEKCCILLVEIIILTFLRNIRFHALSIVVIVGLNFFVISIIQV